MPGPSPQIVSGTSSDGLNSINAAGAAEAATSPSPDRCSTPDRYRPARGQIRWPNRRRSMAGRAERSGGQRQRSRNSLASRTKRRHRAGGQNPWTLSGGDFSVFRFSGSGTLLWRTPIDSGFFDAVRARRSRARGRHRRRRNVKQLPSGPNNSVFVVVDLDATGRERWRYRALGQPRSSKPAHSRSMAAATLWPPG